MIEREKTLLNYLPFGVLILGNKNEVIYMNPWAERTLGKKLEQELSLRDIFSDENIRVFSFATGRVRDRNQPLNFRMVEGERFFEVYLSPITNEENVIGIVAVVQEITEEIKRASGRASFLKSLMNRIEGALVDIKNVINALLKGEKEKGELSAKDLLDSLKKIESDLFRVRSISYFPAKRCEIELGYILRMVTVGFSEELEERGIKLRFNSGTLPVTVFCSQDELERILVTIFREIVSRAEGDEIWISVDERKIKDARFGVCLITFRGIANRDVFREVEEFAKNEEGMFEVISMENMGTTVGLALPAI